MHFDILGVLSTYKKVFCTTQNTNCACTKVNRGIVSTFNLLESPKVKLSKLGLEIRMAPCVVTPTPKTCHNYLCNASENFIRNIRRNVIGLIAQMKYCSTAKWSSFSDTKFSFTQLPGSHNAVDSLLSCKNI